MGEPQAGALLGLFLPFVIMLVFFWLVLIRPQQKQQKQRQEMLKALAKGDQVVEIKLDRSGVQSVAKK